MRKARLRGDSAPGPSGQQGPPTLPRKLAVIGSNSFSGASFVEYALQQGAEVIGISRSPEPHRVLLPYRWSGSDERFRFQAYDLNHHLDEIMRVLDDERPEYVVNFAAQSMVAESWARPTDWFMTNVVGTVRLHERLRHCDYLTKYVHITTPEVYGSTNAPVREGDPFNPSTPYAVSRAAADMSLRTFVQAYGFPAVLTRAANVYGPGQRFYRIVPRTILFIKLGRKLRLEGGGRSRRSFVHIRDVSDATWRVMMSGVVGEAYHIATRETITVRELVERLCRKLGAAFEDSVEIVGERLGKDSVYILDSSKIRDTLGWRDTISLDQGLDECIAWVEANLEELRNQPFDYVHKP